MKLLFDENISYRVVALVPDIFPGSEQVRRLGLLGKTDRLIWDYARQHNFIVVTHDEDFVELSALYGAPPKVLLLRAGNLPTASLAALLLRHHATIEAELAPSTDTYCLTLYAESQ
jgi:predicted nuclease of predicted toxin-antitoxin system